MFRNSTLALLFVLNNFFIVLDSVVKWYRYFKMADYDNINVGKISVVLKRSGFYLRMSNITISRSKKQLMYTVHEVTHPPNPDLHPTKN